MNASPCFPITRLFCALLVISRLFAVDTSPKATGTDRPNIIFLLADDQRNDVLGCYGNTMIKTPTLDRLAQEGIRFDNAFCEVPICAASQTAPITTPENSR